MSSSGSRQQRSHRSAGATSGNSSSSARKPPRDAGDRGSRDGPEAGAAVPIPVSGRPSKADTLRTSSGRTTTEKEAKVLSQELAALLTKKDPWHQDVIFARENLRRHCLALIFRAPADAAASATSSSVASQSKQRLSALSALFLSTSHAVIHHFRQRLSAMDKSMAQAASERAMSRRDDGAGSTPRKHDSPRSGPAGPVPTSAQRRRLLHSFRDFLAKEETFWRDLLIRIVGVFDVEEARTPLRLLQLGVGDWEPDPRLSSNKEIHEQAILLCHRTLICMGDLARYKELYAENKNQNLPRPRGGKLAPRPDANDKEKSWSRAYEAYHQARLLVPDDGNPSNQLAVLAGYEHDSLSTVYHYYRALCVKKAFTTARQNLAPTFAKILTSWESDEKAKADKKRLQARNGSYADVDGDDGTPGSRAKMEKMDAAGLVDDFQKAFVILHAILFQGTNMEQLPQQFTKVTLMFSVCVSRRILPSDIVVKVIVTALSAWWYARMDRRTGDASDRAAAVDPAALESSALMHALAMLSELMVIANAETREVELAEALQPPPTAPRSEWGMLLAQSITAVLRRALPALRIASMWLLSNADYLARYDSTAATFKPASTSEGGIASADPSAPPPEVCMAIRGFWNTYVRCVNSLSRAFPADIMSPVASASGELMLEEDIDMLGFMPLRRRMKEASIGKAAKEVSGALASAAAASSTLHPNEEQVLRVGDLLSDAKLLAQSESCPVIVQNGIFFIRSKRLNPASQSWNPKASPIPAARSISPLSGDDDSADESEEGSDDGGGYDDELDDLNLPKEVDELSSTVGSYEEDLLDLAMRVTTGNGSFVPAAQSDLLGHGALEDEEDDDEVLYPTRPTQASYTNATTNTPSPPAQYAKASAPASGLSPAAAGAPTRTASDLLLQVLQGNSLDLRSSPLLPNVPGKAADGGYASAGGLSSSPFLHASSTPALGALPSNRSIWSTASTGSDGLSAVPGASASGLVSAGSSPGMQHRMRPGNASFAGTGNTVAGSSGNAEALFNSMPNQSQQAAPPGLASGSAPSAGRPVATPAHQHQDQRSAQLPAAAASPFGMGDIWAPVAPSAQAFLSSGQRAVPSQFGQPANSGYQAQLYAQRATPAISPHAQAQQQPQGYLQHGRQYG